MDAKVINVEKLLNVYIPKLKQIYLEKGENQEEFIESLNKKLREDIEIKLLIWQTNYIATCFCNECHFNEAKELCNQSIQEALQVDDFDKRKLYNLYADYGLIFKGNDEYDEAIKQMKIAMDLLTVMNTTEGIKLDAAYICFDIGHCYYDKVVMPPQSGTIYDMDKAREYFDKAKSYALSYQGKESVHKLLAKLEEAICDTYDILCDNGHISSVWAEEALKHFEDEIERLHSDNNDVISGFELDFCKRKLSILRFLNKEEEWKKYCQIYKQLEISRNDYWDNLSGKK